MQKTKKKLLMPLLWTLVIITAVASSVAMTQSAKVATLRLEQTWTYDAPEYVSITADANNGTFGSSDTYETCIRFSNIFTGTNLIPEPSRVGYTLNGWKYKVTAEGNIWSSYSNVSDHIPFTDHLYLQAQWNANSYSITYRDGGDTSFSGSHAPNYPISHTYDTATTLKTASKTGYTFGGWYTSSSCTGSAITSLGATEYTSNITLYAKWSANSYSITYYDEGGSGFTGTHASGYPTSHSYGTATTLLSPTKEGYSFGGWYTTSACTGDAVTSLGATAYTDNIILYAKWEEVTSYRLTIEFGNDIETGEMSGFEIRSVDLNELNDLYSPFYFNQGLVYSYVRNNCTLIEDIASKLKGGQRNFSIEISANITTIAILFVGTGCDTIKNVSYNDGLTEEYCYFGDCLDKMMGIYSVNFAYTEHSISFPIIRLDD